MIVGFPGIFTYIFKCNVDLSIQNVCNEPYLNMMMIMMMSLGLMNLKTVYVDVRIRVPKSLWRVYKHMRRHVQNRTF